MRILFLEEIEKRYLPREVDNCLITLGDRTKKTYGQKSVVLPDVILNQELHAIERTWAPDTCYQFQIKSFIERYKESHSGKAIDIIICDFPEWKLKEKFKNIEDVVVYSCNDYIDRVTAEDLLKNDPDYPLKHVDYWQYLTRNIK